MERDEILTVEEDKICWNGVPFNELPIEKLQAMVHHVITSPIAWEQMFGEQGYIAMHGRVEEEA